MSEDKISLRQLLVLLAVGLLSPAIRALPAGPAAIAGEAGWLSALAALPVLLGLCWVLFRLSACAAQGEGLGELLPRLLGRPLGKLTLAAYLLWGLVLLCVNTRLYGQRFLSTGYRNTPLLLYIVVILAVVLWAARGKLAAFARAGEVFYLILAVTLGIVVFLALFRVEWENLLPIWTEDMPGIARSSLPVLSVLGYCVFASFLTGGVARRSGDRRRCMWWAAAFCLALTVLQFANLGAFGPELVARMDQPFFMMVKGIGVEGAFQRVESVVMALWVLSDLAFLGLLTFACCAAARALFGFKELRSAAVPVTILTLLGSVLLFPDAFALDLFAQMVVGPGNLLFGFVFPTLFALVSVIRRIGVVTRYGIGIGGLEEDIVGVGEGEKGGRKKIRKSEEKS